VADGPQIEDVYRDGRSGRSGMVPAGTEGCRASSRTTSTVNAGTIPSIVVLDDDDEDDDVDVEDDVVDDEEVEVDDVDVEVDVVDVVEVVVDDEVVGSVGGGGSVGNGMSPRSGKPSWLQSTGTPVRPSTKLQ
jgi:hypothetical protein